MNSCNVHDTRANNPIIDEQERYLKLGCWRSGHEADREGICVVCQRLVSHTTATESLLFQPLCWKRWPLCHGVGGCWAQAQRGLQDHTRRGSSRPTQRQCLSRKTRCMGWPEANVSPTPMHLSLFPCGRFIRTPGKGSLESSSCPWAHRHLLSNLHERIGNKR